MYHVINTETLDGETEGVWPSLAQARDYVTRWGLRQWEIWAARWDGDELRNCILIEEAGPHA